MKEVKHLKKMALKAIVSSRLTADDEKSQGLKALAKGFRAQAKILKRKKKSGPSR